MSSKKQFLQDYVKAIRNGNAAIFAGAGLSRPSGFVVWKELLRPLADNIGLNIDQEHDLTAVAQYVRNQNGNRYSINSNLLEAYCRDVEVNENVSIITRLPIFTYWTTNYDKLIEDGLRNANRNPDVKIESKQLPNTKRDRDAIVYKMHGDIEHVADAVLTKDDYIKYDKKYPFFKNVLQSDLISKTFLFIGFSFEDPNLDNILSQIKLLMDENVRDHYCFMKRVSKDAFENDECYGYEKARQDLREKDLNRYGIQTIFVDDYNEITEILRNLEESVLSNNIFISGSIEYYDEIWTKERIETLTYKLSNQLVKKEFKITSGFGIGIGSSVINGALDEIYKSKYKQITEHLCLRPFPQGIMNPEERKEKWSKYREDIIGDNGIVIFIAGNKNYNDKQRIADGCLQEFKIAKNKKRIIIPVGCTGNAAECIYNEVKENINEYPYLKPYINDLKDETNIDKIVQIIIDICEENR